MSVNTQLLDTLITSTLNKIENGRQVNKFQIDVENHANEILKIGKETEAFMNTQQIQDSNGKTIILDAYGNQLSSIGTDDKVEYFSSYGFSNSTLNWALWTALYNDSWVFKRVIDKPSQDMVRSGITINGITDKEKEKKIYTELKRKSFDLIQILQWGALYGGSVGVMMFDNLNDDDYALPLSINKLRQAKTMRIYTTDRWYGVAVINNDVVNDMNSIDFGKPKMYQITFADGKTLKVHHDYILRYEHRIAPKLIKTGQLQGWGYAEGAHILNELSRDEQLRTSIQSLVNKALIEVIKMPGMRGVFLGADEENQTQLQKRLEQVNWGRTFNSLTFLDKEDEYQQNQFSGLSGLSDLLEKEMWQISAAVEMQGVLFGDLKQGFSNDVDALQRYDNTIQNRDESYYRPVLEKLLTTLYKMYDINVEVDFNFNSLLAKKQDEERMDGIKKFIETLSTLLSDGVIDTSKYAQILTNYSQNGKINFEFNEQEVNELKNKSEEEMENIDLDNV